MFVTNSSKAQVPINQPIQVKPNPAASANPGLILQSENQKIKRRQEQQKQSEQAEKAKEEDNEPVIEIEDGGVKQREN